MTKFWATLFKRKTDLPKTKHVIKHAFTVDGVEYFQFDDIFNLPYQRGLQALVHYREVRQNTDLAFLKQHTQAMRKALTATQSRPMIDVASAYILNEQLDQRLQLPPDPELLYKLASVVYFDKTENPEVYEFGYGQKKIDFWKKKSGLKEFFLQKPLRELLPFLEEYTKNIETYQQMMKEVNAQHSASLSARL